MLLIGLVAAALCIGVAAVLVSYSLRLFRETTQVRRDSEAALVSDCLANVDRIIDLRDRAPRSRPEVVRSLLVTADAPPA